MMRRATPQSPRRCIALVTSALLRRCNPGTTDEARDVAETIQHHRGQILGLAGDAGTGAHRVAILMRGLRWQLAVLKRARQIHHDFPEMHDAEIGRTEMLAGPVGDRALAVLHGGVLLGDALDAGIAPGPLELAVDQIVVALVAQR